MLWLLLLLIVIFGLGVDTDYGTLRWLVLALWPASVLFLLSAALGAKLFIFLGVASLLLFLAGTAIAIMPGKAKFPTIIVGAMLVVMGSVALQNAQVQWQMTRYANASELRIIERSSLFESIRNRSDGYQEPHGVACDSENWPYLWSYRTRAWMALPSTTRYGGNTRQDVMAVCLQHPLDSYSTHPRATPKGTLG